MNLNLHFVSYNVTVWSFHGSKTSKKLMLLEDFCVSLSFSLASRKFWWRNFDRLFLKMFCSNKSWDHGLGSCFICFSRVKIVCGNVWSGLSGFWQRVINACFVIMADRVALLHEQQQRCCYWASLLTRATARAWLPPPPPFIITTIVTTTPTNTTPPPLTTTVTFYQHHGHQILQKKKRIIIMNR